MLARLAVAVDLGVARPPARCRHRSAASVPNIVEPAERCLEAFAACGKNCDATGSISRANGCMNVGGRAATPARGAGVRPSAASAGLRESGVACAGAAGPARGKASGRLAGPPPLAIAQDELGPPPPVIAPIRILAAGDVAGGIEAGHAGLASVRREPDAADTAHRALAAQGHLEIVGEGVDAAAVERQETIGLALAQPGALLLPGLVEPAKTGPFNRASAIATWRSSPSSPRLRPAASLKVAQR